MLKLVDLDYPFKCKQCKDDCEGPMCHLDNQLVLREILPKRNIAVEMVPGDEPMVSNFRESVNCMSSLNTSCEESCQEYEREKSVH